MNNLAEFEIKTLEIFGGAGSFGEKNNQRSKTR
jgi:hypothetical protein